MTLPTSREIQLRGFDMAMVQELTPHVNGEERRTHPAPPSSLTTRVMATPEFAPHAELIGRSA